MDKLINAYQKIKPEAGFTHFAYTLINLIIPVILLILVRLELVFFAVALIVLAKWRIFAVKPRYWLVNIRSNLVDIFIGLSTVFFMFGTLNLLTQVFWVVFYSFWLVYLKPKSKQIPVIIQALIAQTLALTAFFQAFPQASVFNSVLLVWLICYVSARHFLGAFEEENIKQLSNIWAWFGAILAWILSHWTIFYFGLPQIALILAILSYGFSVLYYLKVNNKLKKNTRNQLITFMIMILVLIILISDWQYKTI